MCQSKAEGGRRCKFHLEQGVAGGMTTYVASVTGLSPKQTAEAYEALEREGLALPDPTREEVDEFLEREAFRVRHEPNLTEKRRESIVARLRAAIGRITPNGSTFHAWKNLVAESWSRVRRRAAAAFMVGALTFSVGACGNAPSQATPDDTAAPVAGAPVTPQPSNGSPREYDSTYEVAEGTASNEAVERFGPREAAQGTALAIDTSQDYFWDEESVTSMPGEDADEHAYSLAERMTPATAEQWRETVDEFIANSKEGNYGAGQNGRDFLSISFYGGAAFDNAVDKDGNTVTVAPEGPVVVNPTLSKVTTGLTADDRLSVEIEGSAGLRVVVGGKPKVWNLTRSITYYMVQDKDQGEWLIDAWSGSWNTTGFTKDR